MSSLSDSSSIQSANDLDMDFNALFVNPLIHLIDDSKANQYNNNNPRRASDPSVPPGFNNLSVPEIQPFSHFQQVTVPSSLNPLAQAFTFHNPSSFVQHSEFSCTKLFVGNLPTNTSLVEVLELFRQYGRVNEQLSTVKDDNYAFVHFYSERDAEVAQRALNDSHFKNRYIRVQYSTSKGHIKKSKSKIFSYI